MSSPAASASSAVEDGGSAPAPSLASTPAVRVHDLTIAYRGHPAVHHLNGAFTRGRSTAVVGPNGAGKSTLLAALSGTITQFEGHIERDPTQRIAYLPQATELDRNFPVRVDEVVATGLWARLGSFGAVRRAERERIELALATVGLTGFESRLLGELSAGQAQRVLFARVLLQDAAIILLDEPFNAIDNRTTSDLLALLTRWRHEDRTVIAVLHDMVQVEAHFDEVLLLAREAVAWGPTAQVLTEHHLLAAREMAEAWDAHAHACQRAA